MHLVTRLLYPTIGKSNLTVVSEKTRQKKKLPHMIVTIKSKHYRINKTGCSSLFDIFNPDTKRVFLYSYVQDVVNEIFDNLMEDNHGLTKVILMYGDEKVWTESYTSNFIDSFP